MNYGESKCSFLLKKWMIITGVICMSISTAKSDDSAIKMRDGLVKGCLQSGASASFCTCQADAISSHVPISEMAIFGKDFMKYARHEIDASEIPANYHEAIIGMAACAEKFNN